jgi:hypothetical protein
MSNKSVSTKNLNIDIDNTKNEFDSEAEELTESTPGPKRSKIIY